MELCEWKIVRGNKPIKYNILKKYIEMDLKISNGEVSCEKTHKRYADGGNILPDTNFFIFYFCRGH